MSRATYSDASNIGSLRQGSPLNIVENSSGIFCVQASRRDYQQTWTPRPHFPSLYIRTAWGYCLHCSRFQTSPAANMNMPVCTRGVRMRMNASSSSGCCDVRGSGLLLMPYVHFSSPVVGYESEPSSVGSCK